MANNYPPIPPEFEKFARWLETPEPCSRLYPSSCNGVAIMRMGFSQGEYPLCKGCMRAMSEQINNVLDGLPPGEG